MATRHRHVQLDTGILVGRILDFYCVMYTVAHLDYCTTCTYAAYA